MANEETQQSPWTRPSFLMAGALVMLLVIGLFGHSVGVMG